jgi:hypothetical protein
MHLDKLFLARSERVLLACVRMLQIPDSDLPEIMLNVVIDKHGLLRYVGRFFVDNDAALFEGVSPAEEAKCYIDVGTLSPESSREDLIFFAEELVSDYCEQFFSTIGEGLDSIEREDEMPTEGEIGSGQGSESAS